MEKFGRSGAELIPLMNDLSGEGFAQAEARVRALGGALNDDLVDASARAKNALQDLKNMVKGAATQFVTGLAPAMSQATQELTEFSIKSAGALHGFIRKVGEAFGDMFRINSWYFLQAANYVEWFFDRTVLAAETAAKVTRELLKGDFTAAKETWVAQHERARKLWEETLEKFRKTDEKLFGPPEAPKRPSGAAVDEDQTQEVERTAQARQAALRAALDAELRLYKARSETALAIIKAEADQGLRTQQSYFEERARITLAGIDKELEILERKRTLAAEAPVQGEADEIRRAQEVAAVEAQIDAQREARKRTLIELGAEENRLTLEAIDTRLRLEAEIGRARGFNAAAARADLEADLAQREVALRKQIADEAEVQRAIAELRRAGREEIAREEARERADLEMVALGAELARIDRERAEIERRVATGKLDQLNAERQIAALYAAELPALRERLGILQETAAATGDAWAVEQAHAFGEELADMGVAADETGRRLAELQAVAQGALTRGLADAFMEGVEGTKKFSDAVDDMAKNVLRTIARMIAEMYARMLVMKAFGLFPGAGGGGGAAAAGVGWEGPGFAGGGLVRGPGSGTSDSIPARLSHHEYVVRAAVVRRPGVLEVLDELNRSGNLQWAMAHPSFRPRALPMGPGFAAGGLVQSAGPTHETRNVTLQVSPDLMGMTLREWFEGYLAREISQR
ncbi:MAG: hypothetical protein ACNA8S_15795 [Deferrisomatales bacterium]